MTQPDQYDLPPRSASDDEMEIWSSQRMRTL